MRILGLTLAFLVLSAFEPWRLALAAEGFHANYVGGTVSSLAVKTDGVLKTAGEEFLAFKAKKSQVQISYSKINLIEYGQKVDRRYLAAFLISPLFLLSKSRQHFLTLGYTDDAAELQRGKDWDTQGKVDIAVSTKGVEQAMEALDAGRNDEAEAKLKAAAQILQSSPSMTNSAAAAPMMQEQVRQLEAYSKDIRQDSTDKRRVKKSLQYYNYKTQKK